MEAPGTGESQLGKGRKALNTWGKCWGKPQHLKKIYVETLFLRTVCTVFAPCPSSRDLFSSSSSDRSCPDLSTKAMVLTAPFPIAETTQLVAVMAK